MNFKKLMALMCLLLAGCAPAQPQNSGVPATPTSQPQVAEVTPDQAGLANPASIYCKQQGNRLEIRTAADGSQAGVCIFPDHSECEEWAYFRKECQPGDLLAAPEPTASPAAPEPTPTAAAELAADGWKVYRNAELGYRFHYPADAGISLNAEPLQSFSILGPEKDGNQWPLITISHPRGREEYRPPDGAELLPWLTDHHLLGDERQPDVQIAGVTAIHLRHDRSPQSYAHDRYYFAKAGQLYMVIISHTGDKEDWELYQHFLDSFQFEPPQVYLDRESWAYAYPDQHK